MDAIKPRFHFRPEQHWINDPNGTIYIDGYYHIFYQYNPTGEKWGNMHWGHTRTKDFIHYEEYKTLLAPQMETGEEFCFSGSIAINKDGTPVLIYTSVQKDIDNNPNIQKAVLLDKNLEVFEEERISCLTADMKDLPKVRNDWRDPYVFTENGENYLVLAAAIGEKNEPSILLFKDEDGKLLNWKFENVLIKFKPVYELMECPNFFKLKDKYVLLGSPYSEVQYFTGNFNSETLSFDKEHEGLLDHCSQFYATNTIVDDVHDRTIVFAFVRGWTSFNKNWNNVISLPRTVDINDRGELIQKPIKEIESLRECVINDKSSETLDLLNVYKDMNKKYIQSELDFTIKLNEEGKVNLLLKEDSDTLCQILFTNSYVKFDSIYIPIEKTEDYEVKLFIDHSVLEIFINNGKECATRVIENLNSLDTVEFRGDGNLSNFISYEMASLDIKKIDK
jgi:beta-fructofuranosidase